MYSNISDDPNAFRTHARVTSSGVQIVTITRSLSDNTIIRRFGEIVGSAEDNYSGSVLLDEIGELHQGEIAEIVIIEGADTDEQREVTEGELAHKYGIQSELPSWHPYVTSPP